MTMSETYAYTTPRGDFKTLTTVGKPCIFGRAFKSTDELSAKMVLADHLSKAFPTFEIRSVESVTGGMSFCPRSVAQRAMGRSIEDLRIGVEIEYHALSIHHDRRVLVDDITKNGIDIWSHHGEENRGQHEISFQPDRLVDIADKIQVFKHVAERYSMSMLPLHPQCEGKNALQFNFSFRGSKVAFIAGILEHARALNALCNPSTISYKRLFKNSVPLCPIAYGNDNRTTAIRLVDDRIEVRFPDMTCNPYLAVAGLFMAGMDGIKRNMHVTPVDVNLLMCPDTSLPQVAHTLIEAIDALCKDNLFLTANGVFTDAILENYIGVIRRDYAKVQNEVTEKEVTVYGH